jgi:U3 small nucleolar RNA-associated protein 15
MADGRVVSVGGDNGRMLLWDTAEPGAAPLVLGQHEGPVGALAVLSDGRVVSGERDNSGRILLWDPADPAAEPLELGGDHGPVWALEALSDGRLVSATGDYARLQLWDPAQPGAAPLSLGGHLSPVNALALAADGWLVSCGRDELRVWDVTTLDSIAEIRCSATTLAARPTDPSRPGSLVIAHSGSGLSFWSIADK